MPVLQLNGCTHPTGSPLRGLFYLVPLPLQHLMFERSYPPCGFYKPQLAMRVEVAKFKRSSVEGSPQVSRPSQV